MSLFHRCQAISSSQVNCTLPPEEFRIEIELRWSSLGLIATRCRGEFAPRRVQEHKRTQDPRAGAFRIRGVYAWFASGSGTTARGGNSSDGPGSRTSAIRKATYCRDRIAPNCPIRHPVCPIVALQRRMRFSAPLARFCSIRCHQRRARRAEQASFLGFVSNRDFRVPRLRPVGERGYCQVFHGLTATPNE